MSVESFYYYYYCKKTLNFKMFVRMTWLHHIIKTAKIISDIT